MAFSPLFQFNARYIFNNIGVFEIFQFNDSFIDINKSFDLIFAEIKNKKIFRTSMAYLGAGKYIEDITDKDQFGNFNFSKIQASDYSPLSFENFISNLAFDFNINQNNVNLNKMSLEEIKNMMNEVAKIHIPQNAKIYQLNIQLSQMDKLAVSCVWESFKNFITIDNQQKKIHLITIGRD